MATALSTWNWKNMTDGTSQLSINFDKKRLNSFEPELLKASPGITSRDVMAIPNRNKATAASASIIRRNDDAGAGMVILVRKVGLTGILCRIVVGKSPGD